MLFSHFSCMQPGHAGGLGNQVWHILYPFFFFFPKNFHRNFSLTSSSLCTNIYFLQVQEQRFLLGCECVTWLWVCAGHRGVSIFRSFYLCVVNVAISHLFTNLDVFFPQGSPSPLWSCWSCAPATAARVSSATRMMIKTSLCTTTIQGMGQSRRSRSNNNWRDNNTCIKLCSSSSSSSNIATRNLHRHPILRRLQIMDIMATTTISMQHLQQLLQQQVPLLGRWRSRMIKQRTATITITIIWMTMAW